MNKWIIGIGIIIVITLSYFIFNENKIEKNVNNINENKTNTKMSKARIKTNKGEIVIEFNSTAPKTVENFHVPCSRRLFRCASSVPPSLCVCSGNRHRL